MGSQYVWAVVGAVLVFISGTGVMIGLLPGPLRPVDYFLCGAVGTLVACLALFLSVVWIMKARDVFYRKRRKDPA